MAESQVVLRYRDGRAERATLVAIDADRQLFSVDWDNEREDVPFSEIKAVFFPRTAIPEELLEPATGSTIAVEFADGEVIRGVAQYNPERNGFILFPYDRSRNERIFVVSSAVVSIEVEKL
jgi:hypothetical protein